MRMHSANMARYAVRASVGGQEHSYENTGLTETAVRECAVLGIDPGSQCTGWGIVREVSGVLKLVACGCVRTGKEEFPERISIIFKGLFEVIQRYEPMEAAIENVFSGKNALSALKLGQARGAALASCAAHGLKVWSYEPTVIKKALVGTGRAEKSQVAFMVGRLLGEKPDWAVDTSDALGVAVCHLNMRRQARLAGL